MAYPAGTVLIFVAYMPIEHPEYMYRCLTLAEAGKGYVAPNPLVGAVLVHGDRIIGEGWHAKYGGPHAEVNCIEAAILAGHAKLIPESDLYVSLEPCSHYGKTPPCTNLVIDKKIRRVIVGCTDPFPQVKGNGIARLRDAGIEVILATGDLLEKCIGMNRAFFTFCEKKRPYIILKWAQTSDGIMGSGTKERLMISNRLTNQLVHKWRSECAAIMIGTRTALLDDPLLTTRDWPGHSPLRIVVDRHLVLPNTLNIFNGDAPTLVINHQRNEMSNFSLYDSNAVSYLQVNTRADGIKNMLEHCYRLGIQSLMVEGGSTLLQSFINAGCWDEARVITNTVLKGNSGVTAPELGEVVLCSSLKLESDTIHFYNPS